MTSYNIIRLVDTWSKQKNIKNNVLNFKKQKKIVHKNNSHNVILLYICILIQAMNFKWIIIIDHPPHIIRGVSNIVLYLY